MVQTPKSEVTGVSVNGADFPLYPISWPERTVWRRDCHASWEYSDDERSLCNRRSALTSAEKLSRFEGQISPHLKSAYNLARWLTRSHEDAEDVVQEAFLRAFSAFEGFRGEEANPQNAKAWLLTIVRNTSLTWLKRNRNAGATIGFEETLEE